MEKATWRFTLRDLLILILIILVAIIFVQKMSIARALDRPMSTFAIVLQGEAKEPFMRDQIQVGDKVYQKGSHVVFGVVSAVKTEPATMDINDIITGQYLTDAVAPNLYNIVITIQSSGQSTSDGTPIIDNNLVTLNQYLVVNTSRVHLSTRVMSIVKEG